MSAGAFPVYPSDRFEEAACGAAKPDIGAMAITSRLRISSDQRYVDIATRSICIAIPRLDLRRGVDLFKAKKALAGALETMPVLRKVA